MRRSRCLRERSAAGRPVRGAEVDDAARARDRVARDTGGISRTAQATRSTRGTSTDRVRHLDNLESRDERVLIPGVGFSIEPGIYMPDVLGVRSEVNAVMEPRGVLVTPEDYQRELLIV